MRALMLFGAVTGCAGTDMVGPGTVGSNIPAVGMNDGQFGFAVVASDWTYDQSFAPELGSSALQVGLVVAGYTAGAGALTITDASGASVFSKTWPATSRREVRPSCMAPRRFTFA